MPPFCGCCPVGSFDFPMVRSDDMSNFMINSENQPSCCTEHTQCRAIDSKTRCSLHSAHAESVTCTNAIKQLCMSSFWKQDLCTMVLGHGTILSLCEACERTNICVAHSHGSNPDKLSFTKSPREQCLPQQHMQHTLVGLPCAPIRSSSRQRAGERERDW